MAKRYYELKDEALVKRVGAMVEYRGEYEKEVESQHVSVCKGNSKTGEKCYTVSLCPILDCQNCGNCSHGCYDVRNDCWQTSVQKGRAKNSAIHKKDIERYFKEIGDFVRTHSVKTLRFNVGGDFSKADYPYIWDLVKSCRRTDFLFFTKNYADINEWLDNHEKPRNLQIIISRWKGMPCENKHRLPESHLLYKDGSTTAPEFGAYFCGGNCTYCHLNGEGCWTLKSGEAVIFEAH